MILLSATDLRAVATVLDRMTQAEQEAGVELVGTGPGGLCLPSQGCLVVKRQTVQGSETVGEYVIEIEG